MPSGLWHTSLQNALPLLHKYCVRIEISSFQLFIEFLLELADMDRRGQIAAAVSVV